ncbi:MAG: hypothetical protein IH788_04155 [Nitrospinae bacterium]|nr:hypothetical protein [Nitrospinota bacterium]
MFFSTSAPTVSTAYIERQNLTMRMSLARLARLSLAFSKKLDNLKAALALHGTTSERFMGV